MESIGLADGLDPGNSRKSGIKDGPGFWLTSLEGWSCLWEKQV